MIIIIIARFKLVSMRSLPMMTSLGRCEWMIGATRHTRASPKWFVTEMNKNENVFVPNLPLDDDGMSSWCGCGRWWYRIFALCVVDSLLMFIRLNGCVWWLCVVNAPSRTADHRNINNSNRAMIHTTASTDDNFCRDRVDIVVDLMWISVRSGTSTSS